MRIARELSQLGTCERAQVGAIIVKNGRCISWGYNGAPPGLPHCGENNHGYGMMAAVNGCKNATHAEANALAAAARQGISTDAAHLFVTLSPCEVCARLLIAAGIARVSVMEMYRERAGMELLQEAGVVTTIVHP